MRTQELCMWVRAGYNIPACCTQSGPAHAAGHVYGMDRWQHPSHLHRTVVRRGWSPVTLTQTPWVRQQRQTASTDCHAVMSITLATELVSLKSVSGLRPCCCHRGARLSMIHVFNSRVVLELTLTYDAKCTKSRKWFTVSWRSIHDVMTDRQTKFA